MVKKTDKPDGSLDAVEQQLDKAEDLLERAEQLERRAEELARRADELEGRFESGAAPAATTAARPTDITVVLDRSGSMQSTKSDTIGSFNSFLAEQRKVAGQATVSLVQFDDQYEPAYEGRPLDDAPDLTDDTYVPRGMTALLDAIGRTIVRTDERFAKQGNRAELVIFVIITDGHENASKEYDREKIFKMIRSHERDHNWQFVFLGANQDAIAEAGGFGIMADHAMTYSAKHLGVAQSIMAKKMARYRRTAKTEDLAFSPQEREEANPDK